MKKFLLFLLVLCVSSLAAASVDEGAYYDIVLKNGLVVDGTDCAPYQADLALRGGKIVQIGHLGAYQAGYEMDLKGLVVAPGFIDILRHNDLLWSGDEQKRALEEGITSGLAGNCGFSVLDVEKNLAKVEKQHSMINLGTLVGQGSVRDWFVKRIARSPQPRKKWRK